MLPICVSIVVAGPEYWYKFFTSNLHLQAVLHDVIDLGQFQTSFRVCQLDNLKEGYRANDNKKPEALIVAISESLGKVFYRAILSKTSKETAYLDVSGRMYFAASAICGDITEIIATHFRL